MTNVSDAFSTIQPLIVLGDFNEDIQSNPNSHLLH